jgi:DNA-binding XRE family transcriptional regulator
MDATTTPVQAEAVAPRRLDTDLFKKLSRARGAKTPDEMAALFGVHRSTIFRWLAGQGQEQALHIADTLGAKVDRLFPPAKKEAA